MFKKISLGVIVSSIIIGLTGCQSELSDDEIKEFKACYKKPTGIALWSNSILQVTNKIKKVGIDIVVLKDGSELILDMGNDKIILEEIAYQDASCYEIQSIEGDKGNLSKDSGDDFVLVASQFFGRLSATDGDKRKWAKEKEERQSKKEQMLSELNKKLENAENINKRFEQFAEAFNIIDKKYKLDEMSSSNSPKVTDMALNSIKDLLVKNRNFNVSFFDTFIKEVDMLLNIVESERNKDNLSPFISKYRDFKWNVEREISSDLSYEITNIKDDIDEVNIRY